MWLYCWPSAVFHVIRMFPKSRRIAIRVVLLLMTFLYLVPFIYVMTLTSSRRYCGNRLLEMLVLTFILAFFMIGFTVLLSVLEPVARAVKVAFHVFGVVTFVATFAYAVLAFTATECKNNTTELYWYSYALGVFSVAAAVFHVVLIPFWLINWRQKDSMLDRRVRTGICYEAVSCCPCLWHVY